MLQSMGSQRVRQKSLQMVTAAMKLKDTYSLEGKVEEVFGQSCGPGDTLPNKGPSSQGYSFSSGHVWV